MQPKKLDPVALLADLIAFDTSNLPGNELPCAEFLAKTLAQYGFETKVMPLPDQPSRASLLARIGNPNGRKLLYNGHIDVVPAADGWTSPPFKAEIRDGRLHGRGACDMKGGVAAMAAAATALVAEGFDFSRGQLLLLFVCDEELHNAGTKRYLASPDFVKADFAVISEPTSMDCCIANRGVVRYTLAIIGKSCHASMPHKGTNAIAMAGLAIQALERLAGELSARKHPILPPPTLAPTIIQGGTKDNILPELVEIRMDRRFLPGETVESCQAEIAQAMDRLKAAGPGFDYRLEPYVSVNAGYLPPDHELVGICGRVYEGMFGRKMAVRHFGASNDQSWHTGSGVPTLVFGPGNLDQAHTVDEFVEVEELQRCTEYFRELAKAILR